MKKAGVESEADDLMRPLLLLGCFLGGPAESHHASIPAVPEGDNCWLI
jgi:hypothetical protein